MPIKFFNSASEFRKWLDANHDKAQEQLVGFYKTHTGKTGISYAEAVDEALCFGWIDGVRKRIDDDTYSIRFTPRRAKSTWSAVNIKRVGELKRLGRLKPSGLKAFEARDQKQAKLYSYEERTRELDPAYEKRFRANKKAWDFFQSQARSYQKAANWWVMSAQKEETRLRRLDTLIDDSQNERRLAHLISPAK
jgi:uncharacterized protein YdeI (YjbR/CyaY-like superfamily)